MTLIILQQVLLSFVGRTVSNQYDILQKHRINLADEEMSEFTERFKVINYLYYSFFTRYITCLMLKKGFLKLLLGFICPNFLTVSFIMQQHLLLMSQGTIDSHLI